MDVKYDAGLSSEESQKLDCKQAVMLSTAFIFATKMFENIVDKQGVPYFMHCYEVMRNLPENSCYELKQIAILHDIIEDTVTCASDLIDIGFSKRVVAGVVAMTKLDGDTYDDYMGRLLSNNDAILVKLADIKHNSDMSRIKKEMREKDVNRIVKYHYMFLELSTAATARKLMGYC